MKDNQQVNASISRDAVKELLRPRDVLSARSIKFYGGQGQLRLTVCPKCGQQKRGSTAIRMNALTGAWTCSKCESRGDLLAFLAAIDGLDRPGDFQRLLQSAAAIAGIAKIDDDELAKRINKQRAQQLMQGVRDRNSLIYSSYEAAEMAQREWRALQSYSSTGVAYLTARGVGGVANWQGVRYSQAGWPSVALYSFEAGEVVNVVSRRFPDAAVTAWPEAKHLRWPHVLRRSDDPKVRGLTGCINKGTMVDRVTDIVDGKDVVICEGIMDSLTARLAYPNATILGAHGAGNLPDVAKFAAIKLARKSGRLIIFYDNDDAGRRAANDAIHDALAQGLPKARIATPLLGGCKDLNEAWLEGWRP